MSKATRLRLNIFFMTRLEQFHSDVKETTLNCIRNKSNGAKILSVELCNDLQESQFTWAWEKSNCVTGLEKDYIKSIGYEICKKKDANSLIYIGEKSIDHGDFIKEKTKHYWLKKI